MADFANNTIHKIGLSTGAATTIAGSAGHPGSADGIGSTARFDDPQDVVYDGRDGALYVADSYNDTIRRIELSTDAVTTLAGSADKPGSADGNGATARFSSPAGLVYDGRGTVYVADSGNAVIRKIALAASAVSTLAGNADHSGRGDGNSATARFSRPAGLAYDGRGALYVADSDNHTIRKLALATGAVTTVAGSAETAGDTDGLGSGARLFYPQSLIYDGRGALFVTDPGNNTIRKIVLATNAVTTIAGNAYRTGSADGIGLAARFGSPDGLAYGGRDAVYVADSENDTIHKIVLTTDAVTTFAGRAREDGSADGVGPAARFVGPAGLAYDDRGVLYVADSYNETVRTILLATGAVTTIAGKADRFEASSADGVGPTARFDGPQGLAYDGRGVLYVADTGNHTIRKMVIATGVVTTIVGTPGQAGVQPGPLPARLNGPYGLAIDPSDGRLFISDSTENVLLVADLSP